MHTDIRTNYPKENITIKLAYRQKDNNKILVHIMAINCYNIKDYLGNDENKYTSMISSEQILFPAPATIILSTKTYMDKLN